MFESGTISNLLTFVAIAISIVIFAVHRRKASQTVTSDKKVRERNTTRQSSESAQQLVKKLSSALPDEIILPGDIEAFGESMSSYWAQQECEVAPSCVVRPSTIDRLSTAATILKAEYDERMMKAQGDDRTDNGGLFAIRSGGHSPVARSASIDDGVLIDMSRFSDVTMSQDRASVTIEAGAKWGKVYEVLEVEHLAVAGGRNSAVGVGGLVLGGESGDSLAFFMSANSRP